MTPELRSSSDRQIPPAVPVQGADDKKAVETKRPPLVRHPRQRKLPSPEQRSTVEKTHEVSDPPKKMNPLQTGEGRSLTTSEARPILTRDPKNLDGGPVQVIEQPVPQEVEVEVAASPAPPSAPRLTMLDRIANETLETEQTYYKNMTTLIDRLHNLYALVDGNRTDNKGRSDFEKFLKIANQTHGTSFTAQEIKDGIKELIAIYEPVRSLSEKIIDQLAQQDWKKLSPQEKEEKIRSALTENKKIEDWGEITDEEKARRIAHVLQGNISVICMNSLPSVRIQDKQGDLYALAQCISMISNSLRGFEGLGLNDFLIQPTQRVMRYVLLLKEVLKNTQLETHTAVENSLEYVKVSSDLFNQSAALVINSATSKQSQRQDLKKMHEAYGALQEKTRTKKGEEIGDVEKVRAKFFERELGKMEEKTFAPMVRDGMKVLENLNKRYSNSNLSDAVNYYEKMLAVGFIGKEEDELKAHQIMAKAYQRNLTALIKECSVNPNYVLHKHLEGAEAAKSFEESIENQILFLGNKRGLKGVSVDSKLLEQAENILEKSRLMGIVDITKEIVEGQEDVYLENLYKKGNTGEIDGFNSNLRKKIDALEKASKNGNIVITKDENRVLERAQLILCKSYQRNLEHPIVYPIVIEEGRSRRAIAEEEIQSQISFLNSHRAVLERGSVATSSPGIVGTFFGKVTTFVSKAYVAPLRRVFSPFVPPSSPLEERSIVTPKEREVEGGNFRRHYETSGSESRIHFLEKNKNLLNSQDKRFVERLVELRDRYVSGYTHS